MTFIYVICIHICTHKDIQNGLEGQRFPWMVKRKGRKWHVTKTDVQREYKLLKLLHFFFKERGRDFKEIWHYISNLDWKQHGSLLNILACPFVIEVFHHKQ